VDPDAVWDGEWGRSRDGRIRWGSDRRRKGSFGGGSKFGPPIVTSGDLRRGSSQITLGRAC